MKTQIYPMIQQVAERKPVVLVTHHEDEAHALAAQILKLSGPPLQYADGPKR